MELHPSEVYLLGRVAVALLGVIAIWLLYLAGRRLFGRTVALLAAALEGVAFLPVFYAHLVLNDAATLAPLTLALLGAAGVLRTGRRRDYVLAGIGLGLGLRDEVHGGYRRVPLLAPPRCQYLEHPRPATHAERPDAGGRPGPAELPGGEPVCAARLQATSAAN